MYAVGMGRYIACAHHTVTKQREWLAVIIRLMCFACSAGKLARTYGKHRSLKFLSPILSKSDVLWRAYNAYHFSFMYFIIDFIFIKSFITY
jgi:hypothetical protein